MYKPKTILSVIFMLLFLLTNLPKTLYAAPIEIRLGHGNTNDKDDMYNVFSKFFQQYVAEYTNGAARVDIFPNNQLGGDRELFESIQFGTVEMGLMTNANIAVFVPATAAIDLPFMFPNSKVAHIALDGPAGQAIGDELIKVGVKSLGFGEAGFRHLITNKNGVKNIDDLKGMKIRVIENPMYLSTYQVLGANPVPMAWSECPAALQQRTIDGLDLPLSIIYSQNWDKLAEFISLTGHFYNATHLVCNADFFESLGEHKEAVQRAARDAASAQRKQLLELESNWVDGLAERGMKVIRTDAIDLAAFRAIVEEIYDQYSKTMGGTFVQDLQKAVLEAEIAVGK
jgi:tripartite ATP-independent transporter DctP family solute receptor